MTTAIATDLDVIQTLEETGTKGLTMLETAIKLTNKKNSPCLPSDITRIFLRLEASNDIVRSGRRTNPKLTGKRIAKTANVYVSAKKGSK